MRWSGAVLGFVFASLALEVTAFARGARERVVYTSGESHEYMDWEHPLRPGESVPPGYHLEERMRKAPFYTGLGLGIGGYLFSALGALSAPDQGGLALVPFFGPWIWLASDHPASGTESHEPDAAAFAPVFILAGGLLQTGGAILMIIGAGSSRTWVVRGEATKTPRIYVAPRVEKHMAGLSISGAF